MGLFFLWVAIVVVVIIRVLLVTALAVLVSKIQSTVEPRIFHAPPPVYRPPTHFDSPVEPMLAMLGDFPHHVSVQEAGIHICSGSLICKHHVLTTARCVHDLIERRVSVEDIKIAVGITNTTLRNGTFYEAKKLIFHKSFDPATLKDDVALIRLKREVKMSDFVNTIELANKTHLLESGQKLYASAFREENYEERETEYILHKFSVTVLTSIPTEFFPGVNLHAKFATVLVAENNVYHGLEELGTPLTLNNTHIVGIFSDSQMDRVDKDTAAIFSYVPDYELFIKRYWDE